MPLKVRGWIFLFILWGLMDVLGGFAYAQGIRFDLGNDVFMKLELGLQAVTQISRDQAGVADGDPTVGGDLYETYLRRARVIIEGSVTPAVTYYLQLSGDNRGKDFAAPKGLDILDGYLQLNAADALKLTSGIFNTQFSRGGLTAPFHLLTMDRAILNDKQLDSTGLANKRDRGVMLWGNLAALQYRLAWGKGAQQSAQEAGKDSLRMHGRVHLALLDNEENFLYQETYLGEKKVLTLGFGFDRQDKVSTDALGAPANYAAWTADLALETKSDTTLFSLVGAYYSYDWGNPEKTDAAGNFMQGKGWFATVSIMNLDKSAGGPVQPYLRYTAWDSAHTGAGAGQRRISIGFNYHILKDMAKVVLDYEQVNFTTQGANWDLKNHDVYSMQWQVAF